MPLPKLKDLRKRRRALDLTQDMLATAAGVTREMISMIENNHHYPRYDIADRIFSFLELKEYKTMKGGMTAGKVCSTHMKDVSYYDPITIPKKLMKRYGFDQLPVMKSGECVGVITTESIMENTKAKKVNEVLVSIPITISEDQMITPELKNMMLESKCVLVSEKNSNVIKGIITTHDLMLKLYQ